MRWSTTRSPRKQLPGAVVVVGHGDRVLVREAIGARATLPAREPMTPDTVFDAASLTKVVATTTSVMQLVEEGRLRLVDPVSRYVPGFERYGKRDITVRHLLTHTSGLRPDVDLADPWSGAEHGAGAGRRRGAGGARRRARHLQRHQLLPARADRREDQRAAARSLRAGTHLRAARRCATRRSGRARRWCRGSRRRSGARRTSRACPARPRRRPPPMLRGVVHDPTARRMGGVAGHAGMFTTADDLARFCRMLLGQGTLDGRRILSPLSVARMTAPSTPAGGAQRPRPRLGPRLELLVEPRRAVPDRLVRPHRLHRHVDVDRSGDVDLRRLAGQPRPPRGQGRRRAAAGAGWRRSSPPRPRRPRRPPAYAARPPKPPARTVPASARAGEPAPRAPVLTGIDVLRAEGFARLAGAQGRRCSPTTPASPATARRPSICCTRRRT